MTPVLESCTIKLLIVPVSCFSFETLDFYLKRSEWSCIVFLSSPSGKIGKSFLLLIITSIKFLFHLSHYFWDIQCSISGVLKYVLSFSSQSVNTSSSKDSCFFLRCGHLKNKALTTTLYCSTAEEYKIA